MLQDMFADIGVGQPDKAQKEEGEYGSDKQIALAEAVCRLLPLAARFVVSFPAHIFMAEVEC